ncbi:hypothetical protein AZZ77_003199, partial [Klebsiella pneumoniae]
AWRTGGCVSGYSAFPAAGQSAARSELNASGKTRLSLHHPRHALSGNQSGLSPFSFCPRFLGNRDKPADRFSSSPPSRE